MNKNDVLERLILNDARNLRDVLESDMVVSPDWQSRHLAPVIADCAKHYVAALDLPGFRTKEAIANLRKAVERWQT